MALATAAIMQDDAALLHETQVEWRPDVEERATLFMTALQSNAADCAALLMTAGADPTGATDKPPCAVDWTETRNAVPLRVAAFHGSDRVVDLLVNRHPTPTDATRGALVDCLLGSDRPAERVRIISRLIDAGWNPGDVPDTDIYRLGIPTGAHPRDTNLLLERWAARDLPTALPAIRAGMRRIGATEEDLHPDHALRWWDQGRLYNAHPDALRILLTETPAEPTGLLARGLDAEGKLPIERWERLPEDVVPALAAFTLCGDRDGRTDHAMALMTSSVRDQLWRGVDRVAWSPNSTMAKVLSALADDDRREALAHLSARFLHGSSRGITASATAMGQLGQSITRNGW
jgi:hypothetical protein